VCVCVCGAITVGARPSYPIKEADTVLTSWNVSRPTAVNGTMITEN